MARGPLGFARLVPMRRTTALLAGVIAALAMAWFAPGLVVHAQRPDLGDAVVVTPTTTRGSTTSPRTGADQVPLPTQCPAGQTFDPSEDDPDDVCDD